MGKHKTAEAARWGRILRLVASNYRARMQSVRTGNRGFTGLTHSRILPEESVQYIQRVFWDYLRYGGLSEEALHGKTVLELGPGDNLGVALRFLACGARMVVCLDKYDYGACSASPEAVEIYRGLRNQLAEQQQAAFDAAAQLEPRVEFAAPRLRCVSGGGAERAEEMLPGETFDLIVSRAVLHEIYDLDRAFQAMNVLLAPGGMLLHKIDLRDYGMFSAQGFHPLEFLTIPNAVYYHIACGSARPNRRRPDYYRTRMQEMGYESVLFTSDILTANGQSAEIPSPRKGLQRGVDYTDEQAAMIAEIRTRLAPEFRHLADEDLLATGVFLVARKPVPES